MTETCKWCFHSLTSPGRYANISRPCEKASKFIMEKEISLSRYATVSQELSNIADSYDAYSIKRLSDVYNHRAKLISGDI